MSERKAAPSEYWQAAQVLEKGDGQKSVPDQDLSKGYARVEAKQSQKVSLEGIKILVAEDNYVNVLVIEGMLEDTRAEITTTENGKEVVEAIRERMVDEEDIPFDVVLMDIQMPVIDGENATRIIRAMDGPVSSIPIIALTAHAMVGDRERYLQCGMDAYLSKPVNKATLLEMIQSVLPRDD